MTATFVTVAELRTNLGIGTLYSDPIVEEVCQSAEDLIQSQLWYNRAPVVSTGLQNNVATIVIANPGLFVTGQSVVIAASGATYNGTRTITGMGPYTVANGGQWMTWPYNYPKGYSFLQFAITGTNDPQHLVQPYGSMTGPNHGDSYGTVPAVREAAMMLAVDIWQARQVSQTGGVSVDGFSPNPYRMGYQLLGKISGLLSPYRSPLGMLG